MRASISARGRVAVGLAIALALIANAATNSASAAAPALGTTAVASVDSGGAAVTAASSAISANGRFIAFVTSATVTGVPSGNRLQIYVRDLQNETTRLVTRDFEHPDRAGNEISFDPVISADGRFVAFASKATNISTDVRSTSVNSQVYVNDADSGTTRLVSVNASHTDGGDALSGKPSISGDGSRVLFESWAGDLVAGLSSPGQQVYAALTATSAVALVSRAGLSGAPANNGAFAGSLSADGTTAAFTSASSNMTPDDTHGNLQIYVRNLMSGANQLVSAGAHGGGAGGQSYGPSLSADGRKVAYASRAKDLTGAVLDPGLLDQVFVRDLGASVQSTLVSVDVDGSPGNNESILPAISADGFSTSFTSLADHLIEPRSTTGHQIYHRDLRKQTTVLVSSMVAEPSKRGDQRSYGSAISGDGRLIAFVSESSGLTTSNVPAGSAVAYVRAIDGPKVIRVSGADRYEVSANVSVDGQKAGVPVVYVASGQVYPDALAASAAAGIQGAPVLLATHDTVPAAVLTELARLRPGKIIVLGGTNTISAAVEAQLKAYSLSVNRIAGANRFEVAVGVSKALIPTRAPVAYVASGEVFPDALAGAAAAGHFGGPILLVSKNSVPDVVSDELRRILPTRIVVLGGSTTISDGVVASLGAIASTSRIGGPDRFAVAAAASADAFPTGALTVYVASGTVFADALSGGAAAIVRKGPVLLVTAESIPAPIAAELDRLNPTTIVLLGGTTSVSSGVQAALERFLARDR
ncbi:cell wall-binding repeat-containing protein [Herbiconiux sp. CPCC 205763]|uniref:Cell wall-binding repeat-containing protein n=1 Tax=Herbiconiux aconitum TaxID=2970913 RepID=A0ABT2GM93_9MICO|nr:cell wall-binding repeat-containing protein [Herbiconiux aconitum]MCS5717293.1 cell wall-binding repeat-containing protein [Herbiconiux aconitum]